MKLEVRALRARHPGAILAVAMGMDGFLIVEETGLAVPVIVVRRKDRCRHGGSGEDWVGERQ